ncbi:ZIP family metal transporter [Patescibacteria group bacterium]|nr:ZIP family metal transporter [Patescibacteria group bacterium]MBU1754961.1 ZIP family metal transporter [Patescibacteria group bacterium]
MTTAFIYSLLSVGAISLISLIGIITLSWSDRLLHSSVFALVSLAVGALLGDAFLHLIPEAYESGDAFTISMSILAGILLFFLLEKTLHWHHHHGFEESEDATHPVGKLVLVSDGVHNLIDGIIIGAAYLVSVPVGIATTIAVILHEIPQEIGDFGVLIHSGYTKMRALWLNFLSALLAVAGAVLAFFLGSASEQFTTYLLPFAAGGFVYIAMSDLIPELHKTKRVQHSIVQFLAILVGIAAMAALLALE